ncbi:MipA/OmpV family protein [Tsuneonella sp. YG55]|uniref:MipA/OmpV family protein n=1 Tax=Tsuneonella litorea TaxID=2976475 RepID=A0A9X2W430_9SPHN|nr:MipA/OmpV family protein [Tsuneonella litorea]MCT2559854.1 MipA/OmpV family protein [Tsuneonella litorea]
MNHALSGAAAALLLAAPAFAQEEPASAGRADRPAAGDTVYDDTWLSVGLGIGYGPSYDGSDDYVFFPAPLIQGRVAGIGLQPRPAGIALDLVPDPDAGIGLTLGPVARLRSNRNRQIKDPVVAAAGKLKKAIEVGGHAGVSVPRVLNPYDSLSFGVDALWDVNGAHGGMTVTPSVTYFTPLSRGAAASLSLSAERGDGDFMRYYYSVTPAQSAASGLPQFAAGSGWTKAGATVLLGIDFDGDLANGGLAAVLVGGHSRMLGDAKDSPYTAIRGSTGQWFAAAGIGYTF